MTESPESSMMKSKKEKDMRKKSRMEKSMRKRV